jgi:hypothetical protein
MWTIPFCYDLKLTENTIGLYKFIIEILASLTRHKCTDVRRPKEKFHVC